MPKPTLRFPHRTDRRSVDKIILFGKHPNPTTDYYFAGRLVASEMPPFSIADVDNPDLGHLDAEGAFVILCRYASAPVIAWIEANSHKLAGVGLFIDDDIPSVITSAESTIAYKIRLFRSAVWPLRRLNRHLDIIWASTPELAATLKRAQPRVLPPAPPRSVWEPALPKHASPPGSIVIAYHATAIHVEEHRFLAPIIGRILAARANAEFEVVAGKEASAIWHGMDRVIVRQPLSWREYCDESLARRIDIMLAPLAPSVINKSRSTTKRIDVARVGAAGIFSASSAYGYSSEQHEILLPYDPAAWEKALLELIDNSEARSAAARATRLAVEQMTILAERGLDLSF